LSRVNIVLWKKDGSELVSIISSQVLSAIPALFTAMRYYSLFNSLIELTAKRKRGTKEKRQVINMGCRHNDVELEVLRNIVPTRDDKEFLDSVSKKARSLISKFLEEISIDALITIEGSYAKDTWLRGDVDLDLFILLSRENCLKIIEQGLIDKLEEWLREKGYTVQRRYAQHPYLRIFLDNVWVEVVPGCRVDDPSKPLTPVDRTPFHRRYVLSHTTPEQRNEVRLLKSFLKGIGVYGAEIAVQGFSGYLAELLVIKYGCFHDLLVEASENWRPRLIITLNKIEKGYIDRLRRMYQDAPLIVVDPVDPGRNVAAALSYKSFATFILAARLYLEKPSVKFFHIGRREPSIQSPGEIVARTANRLENIVLVTLSSDEPEPPDNLWGIARRVARLVKRMLEINDFRVLDHGVYVNKDGTRALIALELEERIIPRYKLHYGPPTWNKENTAKFLEKHLASNSIGPWVDESGRLVVIMERKYIDAIDAISETMNQWLPSSARKYRVKVSMLLGLLDTLHRDELQWLEKFVTKRPHWMNSYQ